VLVVRVLENAVGGVSSAPAVGAAAPSQPPAATRSTQLGQRSGTGAKRTEKFVLTSNEWRVRWTAKDTGQGGLLQVFAHKPGQQFPTEIPINTHRPSEKSDVSYVQSSGTFYLQCNCPNVEWTITGEQEIP
jgi:hypothetical protein